MNYKNAQQKRFYFREFRFVKYTIYIKCSKMEMKLDNYHF